MNRPLWNTQNDLAETVRAGVDKLLFKVEAHGQAKD
jgi:hypothetical protein